MDKYKIFDEDIDKLLDEDQKQFAQAVFYDIVGSFFGVGIEVRFDAVENNVIIYVVSNSGPICTVVGWECDVMDSGAYQIIPEGQEAKDDESDIFVPFADFIDELNKVVRATFKK